MWIFLDEMNKDWWRGLLGMTRTERIGSYALLVIMGITVAIAFSYRSCSLGNDEVSKAKEMLMRNKLSQQMQDSICKAKADSAKAKSLIKKKAKTKKNRKIKKTQYEDRELQEVPQY